MKLKFNRLATLGLTLATFVACGDSTTDFDNNGEGGSGGSTSTGPGSGNGASGGGSQTQGAIVINEIMYNPSASSDENGEWIELHNPGTESVDLSGWVLRDNASNLFVIESLVAEPGAYLVLGRSAAQNGGAPVDLAYGDMFKLSNGMDAVVLENANAEIVDEVAYDATAPWPTDVPGVSIELIAADLDNGQPASWEHAVQAYGDGDLGTPGRANGGTVQIPGFDVDDSVVSWHQPALETTILFAPEDNLEAHVLAQLGSAQSSIKLAFFNIRLDTVKDLLVAKKNAGVEVSILLDEKQQQQIYNTMGAELVALGLDVTLVANDRATNATMHNKFAVIDDQLVMTGSANYSYTGLHVSDEDLVTVHDPSLAGRYASEFDEIVAGGDEASAPYTGSPAVMAFMGPEDNLQYKVVDAIDAAQTSVVVAMFQLNTSMIVDALVDAHQRGVTVVVMLDEAQADNEQSDEELAAAGIDVILADATGNSAAEMHSKFVVIDHQTVMMGSYNWTNLGSFYNDENILVLADAHLAARVEGKFADMIGAYNASPSALGLTTGAQSITFSVGNVTLDPGLEIVVVGSGPLAQGVVLQNGSATIMVDAGTRLTYHYEVRDNGQMLASEFGGHAFSVPYAPGPFVVSDAYVP